MHTAETPCNFCKLDDLGSRREIAWDVEESGGDSEGSVLHGLAHEGAHFVELFGSSGAVDEPHHFGPYTTLPYEGRIVDAELQSRQFFEEGSEGNRGAAIVAFDDGGDALAQDIFGGGKAKDGSAGVAVYINKAWGHYQSGYIDSLNGGLGGKNSDGGDEAVTNSDVGTVPGGTCSIDHAGVGKENVELG